VNESLTPTQASFEAALWQAPLVGSPCGPGHLGAHAGVTGLVQAASLDCGPRLRLHPDAPRRGRDQFIHSF